MLVRTLLLTLCLLVQTTTTFADAPSRGTAPILMSGNRVYARVEFINPGGRVQPAYLVVDPGSPSMALSPSMIANLHADQGVVFRVGRLPVRVASVEGDPEFPFTLSNGASVVGALPASVLRRFEVRYDYARRRLTLGEPGTLTPEGIAVPVHVDGQTGLAAIDVTIDGREYALTVDNGSGYTWLRKSAAVDWLQHHPDWLRGIGAVGPSNMRMADDGIEPAGEVLRIAKIDVGALRMLEVGALAIGLDSNNRDFMDWYSAKNAVPVIGWLGGNVLKNYRITIDYQHGVSFWRPETPANSHDLDYVGFTLRHHDQDYFVAGIATQGGSPTVVGAQVNDKLIRVDRLTTHGATRAALFAALQGRPGEVRRIVLERNGAQIEILTSVTAF